MLTNQLIDQQRVAASGALQDHNDTLRGLGFCPPSTSNTFHSHQWQVLAHFEHALAARQRMQIFFTRLEDSITAFSGRIKTSSATLTDMPSRMASVRAAGCESWCPRPALRLDLNVTAHLLNITFHHVHAHAAAGNVGDLLCG